MDQWEYLNLKTSIKEHIAVAKAMADLTDATTVIGGGDSCSSS